MSILKTVDRKALPQKIQTVFPSYLSEIYPIVGNKRGRDHILQVIGSHGPWDSCWALFALSVGTPHTTVLSW